jgi:hypothetical protein
MPYKAKGKCVYKKDTGAKVGCTKGNVNDYLAALYMHADGKDESVQKEEEELVGGKADNMSADDIAKKHSTSADKIKDQIRRGTEDEKGEHTTDTKAAREMAKDHLAQYPNYYNNKKEMDKAASKAKKMNEGTETSKDLIKRLIRENLLK